MPKGIRHYKKKDFREKKNFVSNRDGFRDKFRKIILETDLETKISRL